MYIHNQLLRPRTTIFQGLVEVEIYIKSTQAAIQLRMPSTALRNLSLTLTNFNPHSTSRITVIQHIKKEERAKKLTKIPIRLFDTFNIYKFFETDNLKLLDTIIDNTCSVTGLFYSYCS